MDHDAGSIREHMRIAAIDAEGLGNPYSHDSTSASSQHR